MIKWLLGKHIKKEVKSHIGQFHSHLSGSFSNIKKDILNIHSHLNQKEKRILALEKKVVLLESKLISFFEYEEEIEHPEEKEEVVVEELTQISDLTDMTFTQQAILKAIYQLQSQLNSPISFKSLSKYLYPGKKYSAVRTTLSEYIDFLSTYNMVKKERVGRETVAVMTKKGKKLAEEIINKRRKKATINK